MAEIPGFMYVVIGASVAIASVVFNIINHNLKLMLFVIIGIIMIIVGIVKLRINRKEAEKKPHASIHHTVAPPPTNHYHHTMVKYCPRCGTTSHINNYYCSRCGTQLLLHKR